MPKEQRNSIKIGPFLLSILKNESHFNILSNFDCGDSDLNEFFQKDALAHKKELFAETYVLKFQQADKSSNPIIVAAISFSNDLIKLSNIDKEKILPAQKAHYKHSPAVKIGRLGVHKHYQRRNIGTYMINMTKGLFVTNNRTGCRFLTVDAYNKQSVITFYKKNNFNFLHDKDKDKTTRIMYFDLKRFIKSK